VAQINHLSSSSSSDSEKDLQHRRVDDDEPITDLFDYSTEEEDFIDSCASVNCCSEEFWKSISFILQDREFLVEALVIRHWSHNLLLSAQSKMWVRVVTEQPITSGDFWLESESSGVDPEMRVSRGAITLQNVAPKVGFKVFVENHKLVSLCLKDVGVKAINDNVDVIFHELGIDKIQGVNSSNRRYSIRL